MNANRTFLNRVLASGIECGEISADDVLAHVGPDVLAHHLPVELKARLLGASLGSKTMTPGLILEVVGIDGLAEHAPVALLWACVVAAVERTGPRAGASARSSTPRTAAAPPVAEARPARARTTRSRASTVPEAEVALDTEPPRKPIRSARPGAGDELPETTVPAGPGLVEELALDVDDDQGELDQALDELVADEPSGFDHVPSEFDIDTKVGGNRAPPGSDWVEEDTNPGKEVRRG